MPNPQLLHHLHPGWQPNGRDLADADVIADWQVFARACGLYLIHGRIAGRPLLAKLRAMDAVVGWALIADRLLVLGERAAGVCIAVMPDEVMRRAAQPADECSAIQVETTALAERARRVGMLIFAYQLDVAVIVAMNAKFPKRESTDG